VNDIFLAAKTKSLDKGGISVYIFSLEVIKQFASRVNHSYQPAAGVVVMTMNFEVILKLVYVAG
jgi:hypothetical protein